MFQTSMEQHAQEFLADQGNECYLFLKNVDTPEDFGIAWLDKEGRIEKLEEKPDSPDSDLAVTGLYLYSSKVFEIIEESIEVYGYSSRGELEITDINRIFVERGLAKGINFDGHWADCGTIDSLLETSSMVNSWEMGAWLRAVED